MLKSKQFFLDTNRDQDPLITCINMPRRKKKHLYYKKILQNLYYFKLTGMHLNNKILSDSCAIKVAIITKKIIYHRTRASFIQNKSY